MLGGERGESGPSWRWDDLGLIHGWGSVQYVGQGRRWGEMGWGEGGGRWLDTSTV